MRYPAALIVLLGLVGAPAAHAAPPLDQLLDELLDDLRTGGPATGGDDEVGEEMC
jgi:hypothetical protein